VRAEVGRFDRFRSGKQRARFCGLTPCNRSSGDKQAAAGLIPAANPERRRVFSQAGPAAQFLQGIQGRLPAGLLSLLLAVTNHSLQLPQIVVGGGQLGHGAGAYVTPHRSQWVKGRAVVITPAADLFPRHLLVVRHR
jgi:hypothetical protein